MNSMARRMFELVKPIGVIPYSAEEPNEAMFALGFTNCWDTYFAGRAAPLGLTTAEVVDTLLYNFAPGEVARHIPKVWRTTTPAQAIAARQADCVKALRRILGDHIDSPSFARAAELLTNAATSAPFEGRPSIPRCGRSRSPMTGCPPLPCRFLAAQAPVAEGHIGMATLEPLATLLLAAQDWSMQQRQFCLRHCRNGSRPGDHRPSGDRPETPGGRHLSTPGGPDERKLTNSPAASKLTPRAAIASIPIPEAVHREGRHQALGLGGGHDLHRSPACSATTMNRVQLTA